MSFLHPTKKNPERVVMLLLGESKADYTNMLAVSHDPPPIAQGAEIWTCNAGFRIWRHDLVFVMDDLELESHRWPEYGTDLQRHDRPIITSKAYNPWPQAFEFPFVEVCRALRLQGFDRYFFNSVPYMLAYALYIGVKHVTIFGADYWHPSIGNAREGDIENAHWWLGFLRARGVGLSITNNSTMMGVRNAGRPLYGYRFDPRLSMDRADQAAQMEQREAAKRSKCDLELSPGARQLVEGDSLEPTPVAIEDLPTLTAPNLGSVP